MELAPGTVLGSYTIAGVLGRGGMGAVYRAVQAPLGREVALKVIRTDVHKEHDLVERFRREALAVSTLSHPNVVTLYEFGEQGGQLYFAMELIRGETVRERLRKRGPFRATASLPIIRDVAAGLAAAHERGILHRDLKPDNIMLIDAAGRHDMAKLLDFGVARKSDGAEPYDRSEMQARLASFDASAARHLTAAGSLVGTPGYVAPECIASGANDDPRIDLYALGVVWFEMLSGRPVFSGNTPLALLLRHVTERAPRLDTLDTGLPKNIVDLVDALLDRDPQNRPRSAHAVLDVVDGMLHATPTPVAWSDPSLPTMDDSVPPALALASAPTLTQRPDARTPRTTTMPGAAAAARPLAWAAAGAVVAVACTLVGALLIARAFTHGTSPPPTPAAVVEVLAPPAPVVEVAPPAPPAVEVAPPVEAPAPAVEVAPPIDAAPRAAPPIEAPPPPPHKPRILEADPPPKPRILR